ncbi:caspase domain-containing protein [Mycena sanguinolenta]|nr:caspase domain-containing protein [Mycena sanguinolenta]
MSSQAPRSPATNQECEPSVTNPCARVEGQSYKALLIGIRGTATDNAECSELTGPHKDVQDVRDLLIDCYGYRAPDITILIDDGVAGHLQPTRANILKAIGDLVKDAKAGDHLCFLYCGHGMQNPNRSNKEEKEECLIPSDGVKQRIVDHELNAVLVRPLPARCQLVAVLDTCHSGSLLNLGHYRCNRVSACQLGDMQCRVASLLSGRKVVPSSPSPSMGPSTRLLARSSEINMNLIYHSSTHRTASSSLDRHPSAEARGSGPGPRRTLTYRASTVSVGPANDRDAGESEDVFSPLPGKFWLVPEEQEPRRCDSPIAMLGCTGGCREVGHAEAEAELSLDGVLADVISLASCQDSELAYEDEDGHSMTSSLVEILRRKPYQSLKEVLLSISHAMHAQAEKRHEQAKKYLQGFKDYEAKVANAEKKNAQDHRTMSFVDPDAPFSSLASSKTFPHPTTSFFARRMEQLKKLNRKRDIFDSKFCKSAEVDLDHFQHPELSSPRPLNMESPLRL